MGNIFFFLALAAMVGVLVSLFGGLIAMGRGTKKDHQISNKLMRARVLFQGLAIFLLLLAYLTKK